MAQKNNKRSVRRLAEKRSGGALGDVPKALRPVKRSQLEKQAKSLMRSVYKPALKAIDSQEERANAVAEKRKQDNDYYLSWLGQKTAALETSAQAADLRMRQESQRIANDSAAAYQGMRDQMLAAAGGHTGTSSDASQYSGFDVQPEAKRSADMVANERLLTEQLMGSNEQRQRSVNAENFAQIAADNARNSAQLWSRLRDIGESRQQVILEKGAKTAEEVARLLDQEIAKAQASKQIQLSAKQFGLQRKEVRGNQKIAKAQLGLDKARLSEDIRSNKADEADADADRAADLKMNKQDNKTSKHNNKQDNKTSIHNNNADNAAAAQADKHENQKDKKAVSREIIRAVDNARQEILNNNSLAELLRRGKHQELTKKLINAGYEPWAAKAATDILGSGALSSSVKQTLKQLGLQGNPWK